MNILVLTSWYPSLQCEYEGIFVRDQAECIATKHNVTLVVIRVNDNSKITFFKNRNREFTENNVKTIEITIDRSIPIYNQLNFLFTAYKQIVHKIKEIKFDLIHAHVAYPAGIIAYYISKKYKIPYYITEHSSPFESLFRSKIHKFLTLKAINNSNGLISVSQPALEKMVQYLNRKLNRFVVSNIVDVNRFNDSSPLFRKFNTFTFGFLGGLNSNQKGLDILLNAFASNPILMSSNLIIAGDGLLKQGYIDLANNLGIEKHVTFVGSLNPIQVPDFMRSIDCFVLSSRHETFGIVVIEALASGVPVIATKCGGPESFINKEMGVLVDVGNINQLAFEMEEMLQNRHLYNSNEMSKFADQQFGRKSFLRQIEKVFQINN